MLTPLQLANIQQYVTVKWYSEVPLKQHFMYATRVMCLIWNASENPSQEVLLERRTDDAKERGIPLIDDPNLEQDATTGPSDLEQKDVPSATNTDAPPLQRTQTAPAASNSAERKERAARARPGRGRARRGRGPLGLGGALGMSH